MTELEDLSDCCLAVRGGWICTLPLGHIGNHGSGLHRDHLLNGSRRFWLDERALRRVSAP